MAAQAQSKQQLIQLLKQQYFQFVLCKSVSGFPQVKSVSITQEICIHLFVDLPIYLSPLSLLPTSLEAPMLVCTCEKESSPAVQAGNTPGVHMMYIQTYVGTYSKRIRKS